MKYTPWIIAAVSSILAVFFYAKAPIHVVREVPVEVTKEIPRELSPAEKYAIEQFKQSQEALNVNSSAELLRGIDSVSVEIDLSKDIENLWSKDEIKDKITLELRKIGIKVTETEFEATVSVLVGAISHTGNGVISYNCELEVRHTITAMTFDSKYHKWNCVVYSVSRTGYFGSARAKEAQKQVTESLADALISVMLEANPINRSN